MADETLCSIDEFTSSDIIYSMREQMMPSDDVVASLLAKISACDASTESFENTIPFSSPDSSASPNIDTEVAVGVHETKYKSIRKPLWKYGSIAAAGIIVLVSAFSLLGDSDSSDFKALVDNVVPDRVVSDVLDDDKHGDNADDTVDTPDASLGNSDSSDADKNDEDTVSHDSSVSQNDSDNTSPNSKEQSGTSSSSEASTAPAPNDGTASVSKNANATVKFNREILAEESVSNLTISGNNYVVGSAVSQASTGSKIQSISLTIPETSTTNQAVVNAQVKKLDKVSTDLMVALDVDGFNETLIYTNASYKPSSLGEFISDAGLNLDIDYSEAVYCKGEKLGYSSYHKFKVDDINELVDTYAFADSTASPASYSTYKSGDVHVTFKTTSNPTDSTINFGISDNGYLYVKLSSGNAFTFNIGTHNAEAFIAAVTGE